MHHRVQFTQEVDCRQVFPATELVGKPLAGLARIIKVQHRCHGIDAQAVEVKFGKPPVRRRKQEAADLVPAKVEDVGTPVSVQPEPRILVFIECRAVVTGERPVILGKVCRHPVEQYTQPCTVTGVNEGAQFVRRSVA